jgi:hypothetical protein
MSADVDNVDPESIIGHYARYNFSDEQAVVLNLSRVCRHFTVQTCIDLFLPGLK